MPTRGNQLVEYAIVLALAVVLLLVGTTTVFGLISLFLVPLPFIYHAARHEGKSRFSLPLLLLLVGFLLTGPIGGFLGFFLAIVGSVMGNQYQKRRNAFSAIIGGAAVVFLSILAFLAFLTFGMDIHLMAELEKTKQAIINGAVSLPTPPVLSGEEWKKSIEWEFGLFKMILPTYFLVSSMIFSVVVHWLSRHLLKLFKLYLPALLPVREWRFPRSLLVYYFISLVVMLLFDQSLQDSFWYSALLNVKVMLDILFLLQGISFCFFAFYLKKWKILAPVLIVSLFIFPFLTYILSLLGIFDLGINLRKRLETRVKRG